MKSVRSDIEAGFACLTRGDWPGAVRHLSEAARREAGSLRVVRALATAHLQLNDVDAAREVIAAFVLAQPLSVEGWRLAGLLEWKVGRRADAIRAIERGLARLPRARALNRQMALFLAAAAEPAAASGRTIAGGAASNPDDVTFGLRLPFRGAGDADWLDRVAREPAVLEGVLRVADAREDLSVLRELAGRVATLLDAQPAHADRHVALARLQSKVGDAAGARASVDRALGVNPFYAEARRMREELGKAERGAGVRLAA